MVMGLIEMALVGLVLALLGLGVWVAWTALRRAPGGALPTGRRAELAAAIAQARWVPGHDEVDGETRILLRRTYPGLDGHPTVLEERVLDTFPARDPAWEARFTEAMAQARFRCSYLNTEESL